MIRPTGLILLTMLLPVGCGEKDPAETPTARPTIVTQSPPLTHLLIDMGLGDHLVGVSRWCPTPPGRTDLPRLFGSEGFDGDLARTLQPEVVLLQQGQTSDALAESLRTALPEARIETIPLAKLEDIARAIRLVGEITRREQASRDALARWLKYLEIASVKPAKLEDRRVLFLLGTEHPIVAGPDTYIDDLLRMLYLKNAGRDIPGDAPWRATTVQAVIRTQPDELVVIVPPEQLSDARNFWLMQNNLPAARTEQITFLTDPRWTRPGLHVADLAITLRQLLRPETLTGDQP